jgi:hypothetical protein
MISAFLASSLVLPLALMAYDSVPPAFPCQQGWLGGDVAYSIPLDDSNRVLWLFGDSYVRNDSVLRREDANIVHNTIAIRTSDGTNQTINYYWQDQNSSRPHAFFSSGNVDWKYWPEDGFVYNGKLYVCLARVQFTDDSLFGFQLIGVDLASVSNPQDPPPNWQISYSQISSSVDKFPGIATAVDGEYAYLFTVLDDDDHRRNRPIYLARIPLSALDTNPHTSLEYLAAGNTWKAGPIGWDAMAVMDRGVTEMTVKWHPNINRWVAVQMSNEFPAHRIWRRQAPSLAGPWSAPVSIYSLPEYSWWDHWFGRDRFFYAGKEHSEFLNPTNGSGIVTYVGNSFSWWDVQEDLSLYVPRVARRTIDPLPSGTYRGLFLDTNGAAVVSSGLIALTSTTSGYFTGTLQIGNVRYPLYGSFNSTGATLLTIYRRNLSALTVALQINLAAGGDHIDGTVSDGNWTASLGADRAMFDGHIATAPQAGRYTMVLSGSHASSGQPGGDGCGTVSIDKAGRISFCGHLADGTSVSQSATLSWTGLWPLYIPLYGGQGCVVGWVSIPDTNSLTGDLAWIKPAGVRGKCYPGGFAMQVTVNGSSYKWRGNAAPILGVSNAAVTFTGGGLAEGFTNSVVIGYGNRVSNLGANKLSLSFSSSSGSFSGRVVDPSTGLTLPFQGVVLQNQQIGSGYFLGADQCGWVFLTAP